MRRLGERGTLLLGLMCEAVTMLVLAFARAGWVVFAVIPPLAFGGIGLPALRALQANAVGCDRQGQLQGIIASSGGLATILGPRKPSVSTAAAIDLFADGFRLA